MKLGVGREQGGEIGLRNPRNFTFLKAHVPDKQLAQGRKASAVFNKSLHNLIRAVLVGLSPIPDDEAGQLRSFRAGAKALNLRIHSLAVFIFVVSDSELYFRHQ
ncbi:hypothetical protein D3C80_1966810 [compost metagenome]